MEKNKNLHLYYSLIFLGDSFPQNKQTSR